MNKKKVLHVTRNFPPLIGGMEKLNFNIFNALNKYFKVFISGPKGSLKYHNCSSYVEFPAAPLWLYLVSSLFNTLRLARKERPHIIFCGSGAAILAGYFSARLVGAKLVCYLHGLDIVAKSIVYQFLFIPLIKKSDLIIVNSHHTQSLALAVGFDSSVVKILSPGTNIPSSDDRVLLKQWFCNKYDLQRSPFILIAGRITKRKGIEKFVTHAMPYLIKQYPDLKLIVIGDEAKQAIKRQERVREKILQKVSALGLQERVLFLGAVDDKTLSAAFFSAEILVFPVLDLPNDVEGFGMVAIEAAAHGLPSLGFSVGGVPDAVAVGKSGWLVPSGQYEEMQKIISNHLAGMSPGEITSKTCVDFAREFEWEKFNERLFKILMEIA